MRNLRVPQPVWIGRYLKTAVSLAVASGPLVLAQGNDERSLEMPPALYEFTGEYCYRCHNDDDFKGRFDLDALSFDLGDASVFERWVKVHDRLQASEMPPKKEKQPHADDVKIILDTLSETLVAKDRARIEREGRAEHRRLNGYEYENALRDLLDAPWLQLRGQFPVDGESHRFNKIGGALDVSHVHMSRYIGAADYALRKLLSVQFDRPPTTTVRHYARDQRSLARQILPRIENTGPDRAAYPILDRGTFQEEVRLGLAPLSEPETREREGVAWVSSTYAGFVYWWDTFYAPVAGKYRIRFNGFTLRVGPGGAPNYSDDFPGKRASGSPKWPNFENTYPGARDEPISVYTVRGLMNRRIGTFDLTPEPSVHDIGEVWLLGNDMIVPDATRFYRSRPGSNGNPLMTADGAPSVAFRWMEVEGPIYDEPVSAGYRLLFGDLPMQEVQAGESGVAIPVVGRRERDLRNSPDQWVDKVVEIVSESPQRDAESLLRGFLDRAYRRPVLESDVQRFMELFNERTEAGLSFGNAMLVTYTAVLASPGFVFLDEKPGLLDDYALASRLSFFLTNSPPDDALKARAARGQLNDPVVLRSETERLLEDDRSIRFREAFLDYWLDLRKISDSTPSTTLYNDYYLDDALVESAVDETQLVFDEMIRSDLPARNIVDADFTYVNERLAEHYDIPGVEGVAMRRIELPSDSPRGGFLTQASVLKVTANGTTTSPVLRGNWIVERILGIDIPPPPPVAAVEPDIRGAVTIRQQLEKHRADPSCASCHQKMDPPGFALESFDVMGAWRNLYRNVDESKTPEEGRGKNGFEFAFHYGLPVDAAGELPDGRLFRDIRDFKRLLKQDEEVLARNIIRQLMVYGTGAPIGFSDRREIEEILERSRASDFGLRTIIHEIVQSEIFLNK